MNDISGSRIGAIWFNTVKDFNNPAEVIVRDNEILDSSYQGVSFSGIGNVSNVLIEKNTIENSGTWGIESTSSVRCTVQIRDNVMTGNAQGDVNSNNGKNVAFMVEGAEVPEATEAAEATEVPETPEVEENEGGINPVIWVVAAFAALIAVGIAAVTLIFKKTGKK